MELVPNVAEAPVGTPVTLKFTTSPLVSTRLAVITVTVLVLLREAP